MLRSRYPPYIVLIQNRIMHRLLLSSALLIMVAACGESSGDSSPPAFQSFEGLVGEVVDSSACVVQNGKAKCWGARAYGTPTGTGDNLPFVVIPEGKEAISVTRNGRCLLLNDYSVYCQDQTAPFTFPDGTKIVQLVGGNKTGGGLQESYMALTSTGEVYELHPNGDTNLLPIDSRRKVTFIAQGAAVNNFNRCAILEDRALKCWGSYNFYEQNGYPDGDPSDVPLPEGGTVDLGDGGEAEKVWMSHYAMCVTLVDGRTKCYGGEHYSREQGDLHPHLVFPSDSKVQSISTSELAGSAVLANGELYVWGRTSFDPVRVEVDEKAVSVTVSGGGCFSCYFGCALFESGNVRCWQDIEHAHTIAEHELDPNLTVDLGSFD